MALFRISLVALVATVLAGALVVTTPAMPGQLTSARGSIRGRVLVPESTTMVRPSTTDLTAPPMRQPGDRRRAVVYLESAPRAAFGELVAGRARMDQRGEQFVPRLLAITAGTVVDFPNSDTTFHNVFSLARARTFDLGRYRPGRTGSVRFDRPGIVPVYCDIHSHMSAHILVFSHPFFALTDDSGRYDIRGVPAGSYTLMVWSEVGRAQPRRVTVGETDAVEADFQIGRDPS